MPDVLSFPAAIGNDESAARFIGHFLAPIFDAPYAVDSRRTDGLWVHLLHEPATDTNALRAQLAAAWQRKAELDAQDWNAS